VPSVYDLKPKFQSLLRPLIAGLVRAGVTPNQVTVAALALSAVAGAAILLWPRSPWPLMALPVVLLVRMALNAIDGMMAREHEMATPLGAILNEAGDVVSDALLYLPLALVPAFRPWLVVVIVVLAAVGELVGVTAQAVGASRRYDGPMGKSDRALWLSVAALIVALTSIDTTRAMDVVLGVIAVLAVVTVLNRARAAVQEVST
jgi:CDP-diacylglycerol--glycerol-3-phosphate 3-phosphatidyltransferase